MKEHDYKLIHIHESYGGDGDIGIKVLVASPGKELSEAAARIVRQYAEKAYQELLVQLALEDPKKTEEKKEWIGSLMGCFPSTRVYMEVVPNEYCSQACCVGRPWLIVTTEKGPIKIGPRKRVIQIDWSRSRIEQLAEDLFPKENTTKEGKMIHAWGLEKAKEYVHKLLTPETKSLLAY